MFIMTQKKNGITDMSCWKSLRYVHAPCVLKFMCAECTDGLLLNLVMHWKLKVAHACRKDCKS